MQLANKTKGSTTWTADLIDNDSLVGRVSSQLERGRQVVRVNLGDAVITKKADKRTVLSMDYITKWVGKSRGVTAHVDTIQRRSGGAVSELTCEVMGQYRVLTQSDGQCVVLQSDEAAQTVIWYWSYRRVDLAQAVERWKERQRKLAKWDLNRILRDGNYDLVKAVIDRKDELETENTVTLLGSGVYYDGSQLVLVCLTECDWDVIEVAPALVRVSTGVILADNYLRHQKNN